MGHACEMETSILLAKNSSLVDMSKAKTAGPSPEMGYRTIDMLKQPPFSLVNEFDELSETGVLGMPDLATAEKGERFLEAACNGVFRLLDEMAGWNFQHKLSRAEEPSQRMNAPLDRTGDYLCRHPGQLRRSREPEYRRNLGDAGFQAASGFDGAAALGILLDIRLIPNTGRVCRGCLRHQARVCRAHSLSGPLLPPAWR